MWLQSCSHQGAQQAGGASPFPQRQGGVVEEGELLLQAAHAEGQVAGGQDEQDDAEERKRKHTIESSEPNNE